MPRWLANSCFYIRWNTFSGHARARGGIPPRDCRNTGFTEFTSKMKSFGKPFTEFSEFTRKTSVVLFMLSKTHHFTCEFWEFCGWFSKTLRFTCEFCESCVFTSVVILFLAVLAVHRFLYRLAVYLASPRFAATLASCPVVPNLLI